jgi:hypothetical protein
MVDESAVLARPKRLAKIISEKSAGHPDRQTASHVQVV